MERRQASPVPDQGLEQVAGGVIRPKYVSSFFCEKCGTTIRLNGVYTLEKAVKTHNDKVHPDKKK